MKKIIVTLCAAISFFTLITIQAETVTPVPSNQTSARPIPQTPRPTILIPPAPNLNLSGYALMDANSGQIIGSKNLDTRLEPASLTKLMTLYIAATALKTGQIHLEDQVRVSENAWKTGGSRMFIKVGSLVPVKDLIQGIVVASGNDATTALAEFIGGTQDSFVNLMNQTAQRLGMNNTHYADPSGLPLPGHYSTPHDLALLARAIIKDYPEYYEWYKQKWITYNNIKQPNRDRLLWRDPTVDGLKTGHTEGAGYCLISSAQRDGMRLIAVVMGAPNDSGRANDSQGLLNYGFRFYRSHKIYDANQALVQPRTYLGKHKTSSLGLARDLYVTTPVGQSKNIQITVTLNDKRLKAPIVKNDSYGHVNVLINGNLVNTESLIALQDNPTGGFFTRMIDHVIYAVKRW